MSVDKLMETAQRGDLTEEEIIQLTQNVRTTMLAEELKEGVPTGKSSYRIMKLLEDMDSTALASKKIQSDDDNADADRKAMLLISAMNDQLGGANPLKGKRTERNVTPDLKDIPVVKPKLEQDAVGVSSLTYDEFTKLPPEEGEED